MPKLTAHVGLLCVLVCSIPKHSSHGDATGESSSNVGTKYRYHVGQNVTLLCHTSLDSDVDWMYQSSRDASPQYVYSNDIVYVSFRPRYRVERPSTGDFNLIIDNVQRQEAGFYTCTEDGGLGMGHTMELVVVVDYSEAEQTTDNQIQNGTTTTELTTWIIIGVFVGCGVTLIAVVVVIVLVRYRSKHRGNCQSSQPRRKPETTTTPNTTVGYHIVPTTELAEVGELSDENNPPNGNPDAFDFNMPSGDQNSDATTSNIDDASSVSKNDDNHNERLMKECDSNDQSLENVDVKPPVSDPCNSEDESATSPSDDDSDQRRPESDPTSSEPAVVGESKVESRQAHDDSSDKDEVEKPAVQEPEECQHTAGALGENEFIVPLKKDSPEVSGLTVQAHKPNILASVMDGSSVLKVKDKILEINGQHVVITTTTELLKHLDTCPGDVVTFKILRN